MNVPCLKCSISQLLKHCVHPLTEGRGLIDCNKITPYKAKPSAVRERCSAVEQKSLTIKTLFLSLFTS